jgi:uncharacterized spore protein YtfJ
MDHKGKGFVMETTTVLDVSKVIEEAKDAITVRRVFGEPYEKNGVTVIPAARVQGGAGGGSGEGPDGTGRGGGSGFGLSAKPVGAFVIKGEDVIWRPSVDANRVIIGAQVVAVVALLVARSIVRARVAARSEGAHAGDR